MMLSNSTHQQICLNASWMCLIYALSRRAAVNDADAVLRPTALPVKAGQSRRHLNRPTGVARCTIT